MKSDDKKKKNADYSVIIRGRIFIKGEADK
nr:MAG TPA: hypothetical protein [Caudoviricetes sp.]